MGDGPSQVHHNCESVLFKYSYFNKILDFFYTSVLYLSLSPINSFFHMAKVSRSLCAAMN